MPPTRTSTTWEAFSPGIVGFVGQSQSWYSNTEDASSAYSVCLRSFKSDKGGNTTQQ
jgi:hypothetical protein